MLVASWLQNACFISWASGPHPRQREGSGRGKGEKELLLKKLFFFLKKSWKESLSQHTYDCIQTGHPRLEGTQGGEDCG